MQVRVDINKVEIMQTEQVNSGEYNTRELQFNIAENMRGLILKALFTKDYKTYEVDVENDSCMIPWEVLKTDGNCELGVYAYNVNGEVLEIRYSPEPTKFYINAGSYKTDVENGEQPTPTRTEVLEGKIEELDNKKVDKKEGYGLSQNDFTNELKTTLENLENYDDTEIKESVENIKNDLTNFYKKSETYNKQEIDNKISKIPKLDIEVVDELPTENISEEKLYLVKSGAESENLYTEYIYVNGKWEKLGEQKLNISHLATKIELENVKTELNAEIERLTAENEQQAEQINYLDKTLIRDEASGEYINIKNSAEYPISNISIDTNIKQDKRDGYNELPTDVSEWELGGISASTGENASSDKRLRSKNYVEVNHLENYISLENTNYKFLNIAMYDSEKNFLKSYYEIDNSINGTLEKAINLVENTRYIKVIIKKADEGTINDVSVIETIKPMMTQGTTKKPFEQYGSMPSIEFPSEIKTPVGKQEVYVGNKNLLPIDFNNSRTRGNVEISVSNDGILTLNGTSDNSIYLNLIDIAEYNSSSLSKFKLPLGNYKVIIEKLNGTGGEIHWYLRDSAVGGTTLINKGSIQNITKTELAFINSLNENLVSYCFIPSGQTYNNLQFRFMIIPEIATDTSYVSYQSQTQDLDLTSELLGTIVDKEDGSYFENRWARYTITGNESLVNLDTSNGVLNIPNCINAKGTYCDGYSNIAKNKKAYPNTVNSFAIREEGKSIAINTLKETSGGALQELVNIGATFVYPLKTPTYTKLTDEQQAQWNKIKKMHTYEGVTNIYTINENGISPVINMKYVKSPKVVEENLQAQIDKLKNSIISMGGNV